MTLQHVTINDAQREALAPAVTDLLEAVVELNQAGRWTDAGVLDGLLSLDDDLRAQHPLRVLPQGDTAQALRALRERHQNALRTYGHIRLPSIGQRPNVNRRQDGGLDLTTGGNSRAERNDQLLDVASTCTEILDQIARVSR